MAQGTDSVGALELDYDLDLGETSRVAVDPWTGRLEGGGEPCLLGPRSGDPDRTSRVSVDPWTGRMIVEPFQDPANFLELPRSGPAPAARRLDLRTAAVVVAASLCAGAVIGSLIAAVAFV